MGVRDRRIRHKDGSVTVMRYITWYLPGSGKPVTRSLGPASRITKTRAKEILSDIKSDLRKNKYEQYTADDPTLFDYRDEYIRYVRDVIKKRSWDRDQVSLMHLCSVLGDIRLSLITSDDIITYQEKRLNDGRKPRTINIELSCLRHLFNIAKLRKKFYGDNPVSKIMMLEVNNEITRVLSFEEENRLISAAPVHFRDILICALATGMRRGEILSLKWDNVDLKRKKISIESATTKSKRLRRIPINSELYDIFVRLQNKNKSDYGFLNINNKPYASGSAIQSIFEAACKRAGIKNLRFHDLRHTVATRLVDKGVSIQRIAKLLGHRDVNMTYQRYSHPDKSLHEDVELLVRSNRDNYHDSHGSG